MTDGSVSTGARRRGRPAQLSRERIVDAVSSAANLDTLTMRELAAALGVSHGALYRWVSNREELFDLISEVLVERILQGDGDGDPSPRDRLARLALAMHDQFLSLPGYASHLARPHRHNAHSVDRIRDVVVDAFVDLGASTDLAEQSWYVFITCTVSWLAAAENPPNIAGIAPRFDLFLDALLRGLPAREPRP